MIIHSKLLTVWVGLVPCCAAWTWGYAPVITKMKLNPTTRRAFALSSIALTTLTLSSLVTVSAEAMGKAMVEGDKK